MATPQLIEQPSHTQLYERKHCGCGFDLSTYIHTYSYGQYGGGPGYYSWEGKDYCTACWQKMFVNIQRGG